MPSLMGLDLSLTCSGIVTVPVGWDGDWGRVRHFSYGIALERKSEEIERINRLREIRDWILGVAADLGTREAWIESYAWGAAQGKEIGELGGVVKVALTEAGIKVRIANQGSARKLLLGRVPRGGKYAKKAVHQALTIAGAQFETMDESDAFCVLNLGLSDIGAYCFASLPW